MDPIKLKSIRYPISIRAVEILLIVIILFIGGLFTFFEMKASIKTLEDNMLVTAKMLAATFNIDRLASLKGNLEDYNNPNYHHIRDQLVRIKNINPSYKYIYFFGPTAEHNPYFLMGAEPDDSELFVPPGLEYYEESQPLNNVYATKRPLVAPPFKDRWGVLVSALVPILNPETRKIIAVFGIDIDASDWNFEVLRRSLIPLSITIVSLFLIILSVEAIHRKQLMHNLALLQNTETVLRESEEYQRILFTESKIALVVLDEATTKFIDVNQAAVSLYGYKSREELIGLTPVDLSAPKQYNGIDSSVQQYVPINICKSNGSFDFQWWCKKPDGSLWDADVHLMRFEHRGKTLMQFSITDITNLKKREEDNKKLHQQLAQAQKMESIGRLAGGVAHDFNNMLQAILGNAELAFTELDPSHPVFSNISEIHKAALRSAELTKQLLAFARKQDIQPKVLNLNSTIESMLKMLSRLIGEDVELLWKPNPNCANVKVDPSQIDQILANLCVNARDAIANGGKVTIETDNIFVDSPHFSARSNVIPGNYVVLAVSDNGSGMTTETLEHIFEPFFTTKPLGEGTGLGLATVYGIVKQNNGFINVYSEVAQGTTFKVYLPRFDGETSIDTNDIEKLQAVGGSETILIVEDEHAILDMSVLMLEQLGYRVIAATNPKEALNLASGFVGSIQLLVADVVMPNMSGFDLANTLAKIQPQLKTLFMSGYTQAVMTDSSALRTSDHFLQKPFSLRALAFAVRNALDP